MCFPSNLSFRRVMPVLDVFAVAKLKRLFLADILCYLRFSPAEGLWVRVPWPPKRPEIKKVLVYMGQFLTRTSGIKFEMTYARVFCVKPPFVH